MKTLRAHLPTPAMLVAFVALLVATSGAAYAAGLTANSVGRVHMKDNAISSPEVANGSLKAVDVAAAERVKFRGITAWHNVGVVGEVPFGTTYSNYNDLTAPVRFRRENGDVVRLAGLAKSSDTGFWSVRAHRVVFTLPTGFRPPRDFAVSVSGGNTAEAGYVYIAADGDIAVLGASQSGAVDLTGVTFTTS